MCIKLERLAHSLTIPEIYPLYGAKVETELVVAVPATPEGEPLLSRNFLEPFLGLQALALHRITRCPL